MKKYELTQVQGKDIVIDISQLFKEEVLYVNATKLAKQFGKRLDNYLQNIETKEYHDALRDEILNTSNESELELIKTAKGRYGGTYLHSVAIVHFLRWLDVRFAVKCDIYIKNKIQEAHDELVTTKATIKANLSNDTYNQVRERGKIARTTLTDAIKAFCAYAVKMRGKPYVKKNGEPKTCPYYIHFTNLSYKILGLTKPPTELDIRDVFEIDDIERIKALEQEIADIIMEALDMGDDYHELYKQVKIEVML